MNRTEAIFTNGKLMHGDCLELMPLIPDKSIDMILADLPYGTTACKWDTVIPFEPLWKQYKRIIKDNGAIVLTASQPFTSALVMSNIEMFRHEWIWDKVIGSNFGNVNFSPFRIHENILVFSTGGIKLNHQFEVASKRFGKYSIVNSDVTADVTEKTNDGIGYPKSIQKFMRPNNLTGGGLHPTQKPVKLFEYLIRTYTNEGETVLDNVAGSGTTAIACINTNRNFILMEKEQKYYDVAKKRIKEHQSQLKLVI